MKRRMVATVAGLVLAAGGLAACGGGQQGSAGEPADAGGTLTLANWQWQEPGRGELIYDAVAAYNRENPQARIERVQINRADYEKTISTQIGSGGGPDVLVSPLPFFYTMVDADVLEPLDDVLTGDQEQSLRQSNDQLVVAGRRLGLVWGEAPYALFWNQQVLDEAGVEPPRDFEELLAGARQIRERTGKIGFATRHQLNEEAAWWDDFQSWAYGFGGGWSTDGELTIDSDENVAALQAFDEMYDSGAFAVGDDASTFRSKFAAGDVGFVLDNATVVSTSIADSETVDVDDIGSSLLPFPGGGSGAQTNVIVVNANSEQKRLATDFVRWLFETDSQRGLAEALFPPGTTGTEIEPPAELVEANPWIDAFYAQLRDSASGVVPGFEVETPTIRNIVLTRVQEVLTGDTSPEEALGEAQEDAERLVIAP